ncbi:MAG: (2Fe-2S)-binding protein [Alphaproteobacteria bacterium]|nr:MAG: (2Fe-2S)-binding protein [Alphaproteobacteria bacterium]
MMIVNGKAVTLDLPPETPLLYVLRNDLGLDGPKFGCGRGQCGACTVLLDGEAVRACITPLAAAEGRHVTTLEGLGTRQRPHPLQEAFIAHQALQCGYCTNGMIMSAAALLATNQTPDENEVRQALAGNLCRCGTHDRIVAAIRTAADRMRSGDG